MALVGGLAALGLLVGVGWLFLSLTGGKLRLRDRVLLSPAAGIAVAELLAVLEGLRGRRATGIDVAVVGGVLLILGIVTRRITPRRLPRDVWMRGFLYALPGLALVGVVIAVSGGLIYPSDADSLTNTSLAQWFLLGHAPAPLLPNAILGSSTPEIRFGIGFIASVFGEASGLNAGLSTTLATWFGLAAMPGCVVVFASRVGLSDRCAMLAGFATLGFGLTPFQPLVLGQQPLLLGGYVLAPAAAVVTWDALSRRSVGLSIAAVALIAGLYYMHFSDAPTALLLFGALAVSRVGRHRPTRGVVVQVLAIGVGVWVCLHAASTYVGTAATSAPLGHGAAVSADTTRLLVHHSLSSFVTTVLAASFVAPAGFILPLLALGGLYVTRMERPTRALAALLAVLLLLLFDAWLLQWPRHLYLSFVPWTDPERLAYLEWFILPPLGAITLERFVRRPILSERQRFMAACIAVAGTILPALIYAPQLITYARAHLIGVTDADAAAIPHLGEVIAKNDLILTDGISDGGAWIPILSANQTLLSQAWEDTTIAPTIRQDLRDLCGPNAAAELEALGVHWVYLGTRVADGFKSYADRTCLGGTSQLHRVRIPGSGDGPWLFDVR